MARLDKEDIGLKKEKTDVHLIIQDALKSNAHLLEERSATVDLHLQSNRHHIKADRLHLTNVFNNLVDNAIKYSNGIPVISVTTKNEGHCIVIEVKDHGIGISQENQKRVFQKFYRVPTGNVHDVKGFGLGLSYVKTVVEAHKGNIKLQSALGQGSTFIITLPLDKD